MATRRGVRVLHRTPAPRVRLICLPHAGGAASYFRTWSEQLPDGVELCAIQYPGRENRIDDPLPADVGTLADEVTGMVRGLLDRPVVVFGHSMGALLGYEVTRRLTAAGEHRALRRLVVSGSAAPGRTRVFHGQQDAGSRSDEDLVLMLKQSGAPGIALLDDPNMRSVLLPAIRNDYRIVQSYTAAPPGAIDVEVTALSGRADPFVDADDARAWSAVTSGRFRHRSFPGGHFYLTHCEDDVIRAALESIGTGGSHERC